MIGPPLLDVWPPLPPGAYLRRRTGPSPFPLGDARSRLFGWGRQALLAGIRALGLGPGDEALVPAYHHGSEVEALLRAGVTCRFYEGTDALEPDEAELERLGGPRVRALHLAHYLGFPQDAARWRRWCDERGMLLLEDAAQAWLADTPAGPAGSFGQLSIFCLYKSVGLPEGGMLVCEPPPPDPGLDPRVGGRALARRHAAWIASRSRLAGSAAAAALRRRAAPYDPAADFALREHGDRPWRSLPPLLGRLELSSVAPRRRESYRKLLAALEPHVPPPFRALPAGAAPFAFPLAVPEKGDFLRSLRERGVRALDFWSVPHPALPAADFPRAARRRAATVCLPVHQELRDSDVERIAEVAAAALPG